MSNSPALKELLNTSRYITYATVNEDGSPHNSPLFFIPSKSLNRLYIGTHPDSLHAQNMIRTGQAFGVIFNTTSGLYFKLDNCHEAKDEELDEALKAHNDTRAQLGKTSLEKSYYEAPNPQRMYICDIMEISTNDVERDTNGHIARDTRHAISTRDLV